MSRYLDFVEAYFDIASMSGDEANVLCPFHDDRRPSMNINVAKGKFRCFSCGKQGDISLIAEALNVTLLDRGVSTGNLRRRLGRMGERERQEEVGQYDERYLDRYDFEHEAWEEDRGFSPDVVQRFNLGYDPNSDRLTIPLRDSRARLLGVMFRRLDDEKPKYLYPKGFQIGNSLFASWEIRASRVRKVALVEGALDAIACWDARIPALALMGSQLTRDQRRIILSLGIRTVVIMTDRDRAGVRAVRQVKQRLYKSGVTVKVGEYRSYWTGRDPGEITEIQRRKMFHSAIDYRTWYPDYKKWLY